jgi:hypothetical protein
VTCGPVEFTQALIATCYNIADFIGIFHLEFHPQVPAIAELANRGQQIRMCHLVLVEVEKEGQMKRMVTVSMKRMLNLLCALFISLEERKDWLVETSC